MNRDFGGSILSHWQRDGGIERPNAMASFFDFLPNEMESIVSQIDCNALARLVVGPAFAVLNNANNNHQSLRPLLAR